MKNIRFDLNELHMKNKLLFIILLYIASIGFLRADDYSIGEITIVDAWARAAPSVSENGAAYFSIVNRGGNSDQLIAVESSIARSAQIHTHVMDDGVARMRHVPAVNILSQKSVEFKPGMGFHIMLMGLNESLDDGKSFTMALQFRHAGELEITVKVRKES